MSDITTKSREEQIVEARFDAPVPDLLRLFYQDDGLSQQEVADKLGVHRATVVRWMVAHGIPTRRQKGRAA